MSPDLEIIQVFANVLLLGSERKVQLWIDLVDGFAQEQTAHLMGESFTITAFATKTEIHYPVMVGGLNEVIDNPGGQDGIGMLTDGFVDQDRPVGGQVERVIAIEKTPIDGLSHSRQVSQARKQEPPRK